MRNSSCKINILRNHNLQTSEYPHKLQNQHSEESQFANPSQVCHRPRPGWMRHTFTMYKITRCAQTTYLMRHLRVQDLKRKMIIARPHNSQHCSTCKKQRMQNSYLQPNSKVLKFNTKLRMLKQCQMMLVRRKCKACFCAKALIVVLEFESKSQRAKQKATWSQKELAQHKAAPEKKALPGWMRRTFN